MTNRSYGPAITIIIEPINSAYNTHSNKLEPSIRTFSKWKKLFYNCPAKLIPFDEETKKTISDIKIRYNVSMDLHGKKRSLGPADGTQEVLASTDTILSLYDDLPIICKKIAYALTYIHGIGLTSAKKIIESADINSDTRVYDLTTEQTVALRQTLEEIDLKLEGDLRRFNGLNIKRLNEINCHRGKRHRNSLPVRGQRTRTNARSRRGAKKTVTGKKK